MTGYESKKSAAQDKLNDDDDTQVYKDHGDALTAAYMSGFHDGKKAAQPAQEPVAWLSKGGKGIWFHEPDASLNATPLYTASPQRKPLTDKEIFIISEGYRDIRTYNNHTFEEVDFIGLTRAIEAAHGIKENT